MFVSTLTVEINGIQGRKLNAENVIISQAVILQRVILVTGANNICAQIDS